MASRHHLALATLLLVALALRLGWASFQSNDPHSLSALPDQLEYFEIGQNLLHGQGLQFTDPRFHQQVWAFRTPGYPAFIAICGANLAVIRIVQCLLDASVVWAVYLLARNWLSPNLSLAAALLAAINPLLIYFSSLILSETLFTTMLVWSVLLLTRKTSAAFAGLAIVALAILVRPSAIALPVLFGLAMNRERAIQLAIAGAGLTVVALFPWALRNHLRLSTWIWTSTNSGITRYDGFNPNASGGSDQSFLPDMPELLGMGEVERSDYLSQLADEYIRAHPGESVLLGFEKIARLWSPYPLSAQFSRPIYIAILMIYSLPVMILAVICLVRRSLPGRAVLLLVVPAVYLTIIHAASVSSLRYRLPVEPLLAVLAIGSFQCRTQRNSL